MTNPPKQGSLWRYVGKGNGNATIHRVTSNPEIDDWPAKEVSTWSTTTDASGRGWSWLGPVNEFYAWFSPVVQYPPPKV